MFVAQIKNGLLVAGLYFSSAEMMQHHAEENADSFFISVSEFVSPENFEFDGEKVVKRQGD